MSENVSSLCMRIALSWNGIRVGVGHVKKFFQADKICQSYCQGLCVSRNFPPFYLLCSIFQILTSKLVQQVKKVIILRCATLTLVLLPQSNEVSSLYCTKAHRTTCSLKSRKSAMQQCLQELISSFGSREKERETSSKISP